MLYVPMLKTRDEELRVLKDVRDCYSEKIIPLIEIISEQYRVRYQTDENGDFVREKHKTRYLKAKCEPVDEDIITLQNLNEIIGNKKMFIDYFRFSLEKYGKNIKFKNAALAFDLSNNYNLYKTKVLEVSRYETMIPVISVKTEFDISKSELSNFVQELQASSKQMALRITEEWINTYRDIICDMLREEDFLLFDIEEQAPETKFMEIEELKGLEAKCHIILLNSPRKASIKNKEYPEQAKTDLINNGARDIANEYGLTGYGDYCGLKDAMPLNTGPALMGAALALFYDFQENVFYSYCNHDTSMGVRGYRELLPIIKSEEHKLNGDGDCPGFKKIDSLSKGGSWNTWHYINAARYIHQTSKYL